MTPNPSNRGLVFQNPKAVLSRLPFSSASIEGLRLFGGLANTRFSIVIP
jgi:hypothetical protein